MKITLKNLNYLHNFIHFILIQKTILMLALFQELPSLISWDLQIIQ